MKISRLRQLSPEWHQLKKGRIGGTRFGQVISGRKNRLIYELLDERLSDFITPETFISEDMAFGLDNEEHAAKAYSKQARIRFSKVGAILSDVSDIHLASPDRLNRKLGIVLEIKCTQHGDIHIKRFFEGIDSEYLPQIINYFAVSDEVREVHWVSYCPFRRERPLVYYIKHRSEFAEQIEKGRARIREIEAELAEMESKFKF